MALSERVRQVAESYEQLNGEERHEFATLIAAGDKSEVSQEWLKELRSRASDIDSGQVQLVDGEGVMSQLRAM